MAFAELNALVRFQEMHQNGATLHQEINVTATQEKDHSTTLLNNKCKKCLGWHGVL